MALIDLKRDGNGYLIDINTWDKDVAKEIAEEEEEVNLTAESFKVLNFLRDEYINNNANQPNERNMVKGSKDDWDGKLSTKDLYTLFPKGPSKQAGKIAGTPEILRKGDY